MKIKEGTLNKHGIDISKIKKGDIVQFQHIVGHDTLLQKPMVVRGIKTKVTETSPKVDQVGHGLTTSYITTLWKVRRVILGSTSYCRTITN